MSRCVCNGLGVYVDQVDSYPGYLVHECDDHPAPRNPAEEGTTDAAARRLDECLDAVATTRDVLFPKGGRVAWVNGVTHDELLAVVRRLERTFEFLAPAPAAAGEV